MLYICYFIIVVIMYVIILNMKIDNSNSLSYYKEMPIL